MPRTKIGIPPEQWELEKELRERYGRYMTRAEIGAELGLSRPTVRNWVEGMKVFRYDEKTSRYDVREVARKIYESRVL